MSITNIEKKYNGSINFNSSYPNSINLEITNICNLRCNFCLNPKSGFRRKGMMEDNLFHKIVDETPVETTIILCGVGEPTLHKKFDEYVKILSNKFNNIFLVTNGQFKSKKINTILNSNIKKITFSLDYFGQKNYYLNKKGDIQVVINNIESLLKKRSLNSKPIIQINMLSEKNKKDQIINAILFFNKMLGNDDFIYSRKIKSLCNQVSVNSIRNHDNWFALKEFKKDLSELVDTKKYLIEDWTNFLDIDTPPSRRLTCRHPFIYTMILYDGRTTFCCIDFNGLMISGNLNSQSLRQLWTGQTYSRFRQDMIDQKFSDAPLCVNCDEWYKQK